MDYRRRDRRSAPAPPPSRSSRDYGRSSRDRDYPSRRTDDYDRARPSSSNADDGAPQYDEFGRVIDRAEVIRRARELERERRERRERSRSRSRDRERNWRGRDRSRSPRRRRDDEDKGEDGAKEKKVEEETKAATTEPAAPEVPEESMEELDEEEQMRRLMGFGGFETTKGPAGTLAESRVDAPVDELLSDATMREMLAQSGWGGGMMQPPPPSRAGQSTSLVREEDTVMDPLAANVRPPQEVFDFIFGAAVAARVGHGVAEDEHAPVVVGDAIVDDAYGIEDAARVRPKMKQTNVTEYTRVDERDVEAVATANAGPPGRAAIKFRPRRLWRDRQR
ncbi:hypothetical protein AMAG_18088 [Allomyces macrogynus ATCC 38327]|uniref:U4/U6.U5 small nuclear ribonucleoprotein 27kDa protein domain-containing protein n=1 Tax=Allomyces macrogynus (strain ATCC 38327) TaxID=578462 RepID=A0A0L0S9C8_ALLM3|nr:hypothetical protein AMAG_18088 [Allomyces macrogynus ATCC 38327]|eukprot:KNE59057.1 hypothetical protein AMAG_18088 [Allomyces macrogynus ATCC 38327]